MTDARPAPASPSAPGPEPRVAGKLVLNSGRTVSFEVPLGPTAEEVIEIMVRIPLVARDVNRATTAGVVALPNGGVIPIQRS